MHAGHARAGSWELMWHGNAFLQFINESAPEHRGAHQTGSINWVMGMARRRAGAGRVGVRTMLSVEPWTIRRLRVSGSAGYGRDVRRRHDSRSAAPSRPLHGARARVRASARPGPSLVRLRRPGGGAGTGSGGVPAPGLGDVQSDCADRTSLARRHAHHVRRVCTRPATSRPGDGMSKRRPSTAASRTRIARISTWARSTRIRRGSPWRRPLRRCFRCRRDG